MRYLLAALSAGAALALAGCSSSGGSSSGDGSADSSVPPIATSTAPPSTLAPSNSADTASSSSAASAPSAGKPVAVNKSVSDPVLGERFTVLSYLRGYPVPANIKQKYSALQDEEVILVQVRVTASSKYYDSFGASSFSLTDTGTGIDEASTSILDGVIAEQSHLQPLKDTSTGKTSTGWVVFTPRKGNLKSLTLRYERLAATTSNNKTIPKKNFDVPLSR